MTRQKHSQRTNNLTMEPVPNPNKASPSGIELVQMGKRTEARGAEDNWTGLSNAAERRKLQNRLSQRRYSEYLPLPISVLFYLLIFIVLCTKANFILALQRTKICLQDEHEQIQLGGTTPGKSQ